MNWLHTHFPLFLWTMLAIAIIVFIALHYIKAGYGLFANNSRWGKQINNKLGWFLMEFPVFATMYTLWTFSTRQWDPAPLLFFILFQAHYFNRSFIYPFLLRGQGKMAISIIAMGALFNILNACMQGGWIFYISPQGLYNKAWIGSTQCIVGSFIFIVGMVINIDSDRIIRNLRKPGDNSHYLPQGGMFKYVSSANYMGELLEWIGFAILTWSFSGALFAIWTAANLVPRANAIYQRYDHLFGETFRKQNRKRILPFLY